MSQGKQLSHFQAMAMLRKALVASFIATPGNSNKGVMEMKSTENRSFIIWLQGLIKSYMRFKAVKLSKSVSMSDFVLFNHIVRRKSDDVELAKVNKDEDETVPVEQVKCLVLKDDVEDENEESSAGKDEEERK